MLVVTCDGCIAPPSTREAVFANDAAAPIGPYSQAIKVNGPVFLSEQSAGTSGSVEKQTARAMDSLKSITQATGMRVGDILSTTVYLKDMDDLPE